MSLNANTRVKDTRTRPLWEGKAFDCKRGYHLGGRSARWGRQSYRLGDLDFEANARECVAVDWPIATKTLPPGTVTGNAYPGILDGLDVLPDGD